LGKTYLSPVAFIAHTMNDFQPDEVLLCSPQDYGNKLTREDSDTRILYAVRL